jgi:hypothetical protein
MKKDVESEKINASFYSHASENLISLHVFERKFINV